MSNFKLFLITVCFSTPDSDLCKCYDYFRTSSFMAPSKTTVAAYSFVFFKSN